MLFQRVLSIHGSNRAYMFTQHTAPVISDPTCSSAALGTFHHYLPLMAYILDLLYLYRLTSCGTSAYHAKGRS